MADLLVECAECGGMVDPTSDDAVYEFTPDTEFTTGKHAWRHRVCPPCLHEWQHIEQPGTVHGPAEHFIVCKLCGAESDDDDWAGKLLDDVRDEYEWQDEYDDAPLPDEPLDEEKD